MVNADLWDYLNLPFCSLLIGFISGKFTGSAEIRMSDQVSPL